MRHAATLERLGFAASVVGLLSLLVGLALVSTPASATPEPASSRVAATVERLRLAIEARGDTRAGDRFDAIVGSLRAGIGDDTPSELAPALETIRRGRDRERAVARSTDPEVERGLAAAFRAVGAVEASASGARTSTRLVVLALGLGAIASALGVGTLAYATRLRRHERSAICAICCVDPSAAHTGRLAVEIGRTVVLGSAPRPSLPHTETAAMPVKTQPTRVAPPRPSAPVSGDALFGRILEITAIEE